MTRKMLKVFSIILFASFILSLTACDDLFGTPSSVSTSTGGSGGTGVTYNQKPFWVFNFHINTEEIIQARLLGIGIHCNVWVDTRSSVSVSAAQNLANRYDSIFRPQLLYAFGTPLNFNNQFYSDPLAFIDYLGDKDGKLAILLVHDPLAPGNGYFWSGDLNINEPAANLSDIIKIFVGSDGQIHEGTVVHEVQHAMNHATGLAIRGTGGRMDTWINEGLSAAAEWIGTGVHNTGRRDWYNYSTTSRIVQGNNFFMWDNHKDNPNAIFDDYATVYLFFNWLRLQAGQSVLRAITTSSFSDHRAVTNAMNNAFPTYGYSNWNYLLEDWMYANLFNDQAGLWGYMGDTVLGLVESRLLPPSITSISLFPGEAVFSRRSTAVSSSPVNINRYYYNLSTDEFNYNNPGSNGIMLTYNSSTSNPINAPSTSALLSMDPPEFSEYMEAESIRASSIIPSDHRQAFEVTEILDLPMISISDLRRRLMEEQNAE